MGVGKLATALTVIFTVSVLFLVGELLYVLWRRRSLRRPPINGGDPHPDSPAKELLYFFCLKAQTRVEPAGAPTHNSDGSSPDEQVIDVLKMLEANGPSRVLCTIKEEDREEVDSTPEKIPATGRVSLQACLELNGESAAAEEVVVTVNGDGEDRKTVLSSPCDSPMFFTPAGSPARDCIESEFVVSTINR